MLSECFMSPPRYKHWPNKIRPFTTDYGPDKDSHTKNILYTHINAHLHIHMTKFTPDLYFSVHFWLICRLFNSSFQVRFLKILKKIVSSRKSKVLTKNREKLWKARETANLSRSALLRDSCARIHQLKKNIFSLFTISSFVFFIFPSIIFFIKIETVSKF